MIKLRVQPYHYSDPETGSRATLWDVMSPSPDSVKAVWGDYYRIARYSDKPAAEEHARTGRRPHGYG
jgi:hypothetical protein